MILYASIKIGLKTAAEKLTDLKLKTPHLYALRVQLGTMTAPYNGGGYYWPDGITLRSNMLTMPWNWG